MAPPRPRTLRFPAFLGWGALALAACGEGGPALPDLGVAFRDAAVTPDARVDAGDAGAPNPRGPTPRLPDADLAFELPFGGEPVETPREIAARTGRIDVAISIDTTGSFDEELATLRSDLRTRVIPGIRESVEDVAFAITSFQDFPVEPRGRPGDVPYVLAQPITTNVSAAQSAVSGLRLGNGGDSPESGFEALYQIATGEGLPGFIQPFIGGGEGGVGFREGSLRAVIHVTDSTSHAPPAYDAVDVRGTRGFADVVTAMNAIDARVLGIASEAGARPELQSLAAATGAVVPPTGGVCATGRGGSPRDPVGEICPLVFDVGSDGSGLSDAIIGAVAGLVDSVRFTEVFGRVRDDRFGFVQAVAAREARLAPGTTPPTLRDLRPVDGIDDTFEGAPFGAELVFGIVLRNERVRAEDYEQRFRFTVEIIGDEQILDVVTIAVTVPAGRGGTDMGAADDGGPGDAGAGGEDPGDAGADADAP